MQDISFGFQAAAADVAGGWLIVRRHWSREYLKYFVALGAGFMLATVFLEMIPESFRLRGASGSSAVPPNRVCPVVTVSRLVPSLSISERSPAWEEDDRPKTATMAATPMAIPSAESPATSASKWPAAPD